MNPITWFHAPAGAGAAAPTRWGGSPLYDVLPGHQAAIIAVLMLPLLAWWLQMRARDGSARAERMVSGYASLSPLDRMATWCLAASATVHAVLAAGHGGPGMAVLFLAQAGLLALAIVRATSGRSWRALAGAVLTGSIIAYAVAMFGGDVPDQVGLATKLVELVGLGAIARGATAGMRLRRIASSLAVAGLVFVTALSGWTGSFLVAGGGTGHGHAEAAAGDAHADDGHAADDGHGSGSAVAYPPPGTVMPLDLAGEATPEQVAAAVALHERVVAATARYADPAVAAADGYQVDGLAGSDFHAENPAYTQDGRILDPERPETLVYGSSPAGPVLLGVMFSVPYGEPGPMFGGPATVWHAHEHICLGLLPPGLSGLLSPLGGCPAGSVDVPMTNQMIHAWTVPGAPQPWGDLDEEWRTSYLEGLSAAR